MRLTLSAVLLGSLAVPSLASSQTDSGRTADVRPEVARYVDFYQGAGRDQMQRFLERGAQYRGDIRARLDQQGLPSEFEFLPLIESGYRNDAVSKAGAVGMWQFIPATARQYGLRVDRMVDERRDPALATDAAVRHIGDLTRSFGSPLLAAAAYNGGAGRVRRGLSRLGWSDGPDSTDRPDFFDLASGGFLAKETRDYVPKLLAAAMIGRDPVRYGFQPGSGATRPPSDSVSVGRAVRLDQLAKALGVRPKALTDLNPAMVRGIAPASTRWIRVPAGLGDSLRLKLPDLPTAPIADLAIGSPRRVTFGMLIRVRRGDSLIDLATRHGVGVDALRKANALPKNYPLKAGMALRLPGN